MMGKGPSALELSEVPRNKKNNRPNSSAFLKYIYWIPKKSYQSQKEFYSLEFVENFLIFIQCIIPDKQYLAPGESVLSLPPWKEVVAPIPLVVTTPTWGGAGSRSWAGCRGGGYVQLLGGLKECTRIIDITRTSTSKSS